MSVEQLSLDALAGELAKARGMSLADEHADPDWKAEVDQAIAFLAQTGHTFTAESVRRLAGDPPGHPNAMGARVQAAARAGLIRKTGEYVKAERASLHRHPLPLWIGTAKAGGAAA